MGEWMDGMSARARRAGMAGWESGGTYGVHKFSLAVYVAAGFS